MKILSVNISEKKGTIKKPVSEIMLGNFGVKNDAHSGNWTRQVSLLDKESIDRFAQVAGRKIAFGEFAENITTTGLELVKTLPLDRLTGKEAELEITQIGKQCHGTSCTIFSEVGNCIMPTDGIFARVIKGGVLRPGDELEYHPKVFRIHVITLSDRASTGDYDDRSGPRIRAFLEDHFEKEGRKSIIEQVIIPDEPSKLRNLMEEAVRWHADVVFTTGGTGVGMRDITIRTVKPMLDLEIPGIMEKIRIQYGEKNPLALLSCSVAGLIDNTLIYTLPGSVKAVNDYMPEILKTMEHLIYMRHGLDLH
ncbi:MAG TPA: molybdenum cofactor synthesis domain-containing protein [Bacteroidales bacterium]|nr:molybdenum cofactor synthesis domain-containing protein [Bacteroidales bacterium]